MKTLIFMFMFVVFTISLVTSANHERHRGRKSRGGTAAPEPSTGTDVEWPSPESINDFTVPDEFTGAGGDDGEEPGDGDEPPPVRHHGRSHHRSRKH